MMDYKRLRIRFRTRHYAPDDPENGEWISSDTHGIRRIKEETEIISFPVRFGEGADTSAFSYRFTLPSGQNRTLHMEQTGDSSVSVRFEEGKTTRAEYRTMGYEMTLEMTVRKVHREPGRVSVLYRTTDPSGTSTDHEMEISFTEEDQA